MALGQQQRRGAETLSGVVTICQLAAEAAVDTVDGRGRASTHRAGSEENSFGRTHHCRRGQVRHCGVAADNFVGRDRPPGDLGIFAVYGTGTRVGRVEYETSCRAVTDSGGVSVDGDVGHPARSDGYALRRRIRSVQDRQSLHDGWRTRVVHLRDRLILTHVGLDRGLCRRCGEREQGDGDQRESEEVHCFLTLLCVVDHETA